MHSGYHHPRLTTLSQRHAHFDMSCFFPQERERYQAELELNRGVYLRLHLHAVPADGTAAAKGIRRRRDKIVLPSHVGASLMAQVRSIDYCVSLSAVFTNM